MSAEDRLRAENARLRVLYENAIDNRERFGWTINHLLECEDALAHAQGEATQAEAERDEAVAENARLTREVERLTDELEEARAYLGVALPLLTTEQVAEWRRVVATHEAEREALKEATKERS